MSMPERVSQTDLRRAVAAFRKARGDKQQAARMLGLPRKTFADRLEMAERRGSTVPTFPDQKARADVTHARILASYTKLVTRHQRRPSVDELVAESGVPAGTIREHGTLGEFHAQAREAHPDDFDGVIDDLFGRKRLAALRADIAQHTRFVITTAVTGAPVHAGFLASLRRYCAENDAALLVLPATDPASKGGAFLAQELAADHIVGTDVALNRNLFVSAIKLSAKHIDPLTGLGRIGQRNGSFVYASPKQRLEVVPTSNTKLPVALMTTGAVTLPNYEPDERKSHAYMSRRTAYIADNDHVIGAVIVEVQGRDRFHFTQVQADRRGTFAHLGRLWGPDGSSAYAPEALVLGDLHAGETSPEAWAAYVAAPNSVRAVTRPRTVVIHDGFNGRSINHHEAKNSVMRARLAAQNHLGLADELALYAGVLDELTGLFEEVILVKSNHDEFLERYLADGGYMRDPHNTDIGLELSRAAIAGKDPLRYGVERLLAHPERVRWLARDEDYKVGGVELGAHGDKGSNGARGSLRAMENAYGQSVSGHSHSPAILRGAWRVGTTSVLKMSYNKGPSSWLHSSCLVYADGRRQLVNVIEGAWQVATAPAVKLRRCG